VPSNDNDQSPLQHDDDASARPVSDRTLAMFFVALATALVLGYLLLSKLVDISQEEDCALAHRKNCGASELSSSLHLASVDAMQLADLSRLAAYRPREAWQPFAEPARSLPA
jgi:hypothetical protein